MSLDSMERDNSLEAFKDQNQLIDTCRQYFDERERERLFTLKGGSPPKLHSVVCALLGNHHQPLLYLLYRMAQYDMVRTKNFDKILAVAYRRGIRAGSAARSVDAQRW